LEVLLALAAVVVAASALYVGASFRRRTENIAGPLVHKLRRELLTRLGSSDESTRRQLRELADSLDRLSQQMEDHRVQLRLAIERSDRKLSADLDRLASELAAVKVAQRNLASRGHDLERAIQGVSERASRQEAAFASHRHDRTEITRRIEGLEAKGRELETKGKELEAKGKEDVARVNARLVVVDRALPRLRSTVDECLDELDITHAATQWANGQILSLITKTDEALRGSGEIESYVRSQLDRQSLGAGRSGPGRVIKIRLHPGQPIADLLWPLVQSFCQSFSLISLLSGPSRPTEAIAYQACEQQIGRPLEVQFENALASCRRESDRPGPGVTELRALLLCLHVSGPGTIEIGPLIINRTQTALRGCVMTPAEAALLRSRDQASPEAREASLQQLDQDRVLDFAAWADAVA
jgi:hypothetical protein